MGSSGATEVRAVVPQKEELAMLENHESFKLIQHDQQSFGRLYLHAFFSSFAWLFSGRAPWHPYKGP